ncbi:MAG TPA: very short patch repair endonuclease [Nitrososphaerales archaeon]|nr:very short patch repair endonuclease [Nitrososphaerales archaeon]
MRVDQETVSPVASRSFQIELRTTPERSRLMSRVRQKGTTLEAIVETILVKTSASHEQNVVGLPGTPDFADKLGKWAIFANGCFWHGHKCRLGRLPKSNSKFWKSKIVANRARDRKNADELKKLGYSILTIWGCETSERVALTTKVERFLQAISHGGDKK